MPTPSFIPAPPARSSPRIQAVASATARGSATRVSRRTALRLAALSAATHLPSLRQSRAAHAAEDGYTTLPCPAGATGCRPVEIRDFREGQGRAATAGSTLYFRWTGRLADRYGWPIQNEDADEVVVALGRDRLIPGFEQGVLGMREGGKRRILIPAELGYRDERAGPLPARFGDRRRLFATVLNQRRFKSAGDLVIDVQLRKVRPLS